MQFGRVPEYVALSAAGSLSELCALFDVEVPDNLVDIKSTKRTMKEIRKRIAQEEVVSSNTDNEGKTKKKRVEGFAGVEAGSNSAPVFATTDTGDQSTTGDLDIQSEAAKVKPLQLPSTDLR